MDALISHGIATMKRVSESDDPAAALEAGRWLVEYGESLRKGQRQVKSEGTSSVLAGGVPQGQVC